MSPSSCLSLLSVGLLMCLTCYLDFDNMGCVLEIEPQVILYVKCLP